MSTESKAREDWGPDPWVCEDCGATGEDVGVPDKCPQCGSENTRPAS